MVYFIMIHKKKVFSHLLFSISWVAYSQMLVSKLGSQTSVAGALGRQKVFWLLSQNLWELKRGLHAAVSLWALLRHQNAGIAHSKAPLSSGCCFSGLCHHAALWSERLLPPRHEFTECHVQPPSAGSSASPARPWLQALGARPHPGGETGW